jgi:hypothetical protein
MIDKQDNMLTAGDKKFIKFEAWKSSMSDQDYVQIVRCDILNRTIIATSITEVTNTTLSKYSLGSNPKIKPSLKKIEDDLREREILPSLKTGKKFTTTL